MKSVKTWMWLLGVLTLLFGILPEGWAATAMVDGITWTYTVRNGEAWLGSPAVPTSTAGSLTIPSTLDGYRVTSIGSYAFYGCRELATITIGAGVTNIGNYAFRLCSGLTDIAVDSHNPSYKSLDGVLFSHDQTELMVCPAGKQGAYTVPDDVMNIADAAFYGCHGLTTVTIPNRTIHIGNGAFSGCSGLTDIIVDSYNPSYKSLDGVLFSHDQTELMVCPAGKQGDYAVPDGVTIIGDAAFYGCNGLTKVTIPNGMIRVGNGAFSGCSGLTSLAIPDSVTDIGPYALYNCTNLAFVMIGNGVKSIEYHSFSGCSRLGSLMIPDSVTDIGNYAFYNCTNLAFVMIGNGVKSIGYEAFSGCTSMTNIVVDSQNPSYSSLGGVLFSCNQSTLIAFPGGKQGEYTIPDGVTRIGDAAFRGCRDLTSVMIPDNLANIGNAAFYDCVNLACVTFGNALTNIGESSFRNCNSLTDITIPDNVTSIDYWAFDGCSGLTNVTIGSGVTSIGNCAFYGCKGLKAFQIADSNKAFASRDGMLFSKDLKTLICCPAGKGG